LFSHNIFFKMVHLATVKKDSEVATDSLPTAIETLDLNAPGEDDFSTSVYGSRYAAEQLPQHEMPEKEMPKEVAYRMIKDDLSLDGNPMLKYVPVLQSKVEVSSTRSVANESCSVQSRQLRHNLHGNLNTSFD
jgi:glutamate decarboxylase